MQRWIQLVFVILLGIGLIFAPLVRADEVDELQKQIDETRRLLEMSVNATTPLEAEVAEFNRRINAAQASMNQLRAEQKIKDEEIAATEIEMADQYALFSSRVDQQYRFGRTYSPITAILSSAAHADSQQALKYTLTLATRDQQSIDSLGQNILDLQRAKTQAAEEEKRLAGLQQQLDAQSAFFEKEIAGAKAYQAQLNTKIADLSAKQQAIVSARTGTYTTSVGDVPLADDFNASIGYKSSAPSNSYAVFSFGAYTHRNGMSQYGAKEMAESGKDYEEIIEWYYGEDVKEESDVPSRITVQGHGEMTFQKYLYGIAEMPASWDEEALKAQAVAARTYAYRSKKPICTTEACQVFSKSKSDNPPSAWKKAVDETEDEIIDGNGSSQYSSTAGGYLNTRGWDTTDGKNSGDWTSRAWESKAGSPWFYKSWYRNGYSSSGANCGRNHPWLKEEEFADIINAWIARYKETSGVDQDRILPITIDDCNIGGQGGDPYSLSELRSKGGVDDVSDVSVSHTSKGQTATVTVRTNKGTFNIPGNEFKEAFNLRAPGYLRIPQSGFAFFNIEHKN